MIRILIPWLIIGGISYLYWNHWSLKKPFGIKYIPLIIVTSIGGPITFLIGWILDTPNRENIKL